jgi:hypothetical protein
LYERLGGVYNIATVVDDSHPPASIAGTAMDRMGL